MNSKSKKTCLIISYGPIPTKQYKKVEGGGMRAWGLAQGLTENGIDVTVSINESFPQEIKEHEGISIENWSLNDEFKHKINDYDSVIVSYCMGDVSEFVADNINDNKQLILDVYVPIYVEVSARESENVVNEFKGYMKEKDRYNKVLLRGDYFLSANIAQKSMYTGVLSSLGIINPRSYKEDRILIVPFGIPDKIQKPSANPYSQLGVGRDDFIVLWFGGLYPWFRIDEFLEAIKILSKKNHIKFVIVGSKNPFNNNKDFIRQHYKAYEYAKENKLLDSTMYFVDWVDFSKRIDWYKNADVVISLNQPGDENIFSWRTRIMDYVWGDMAIITNGGDPLSDELIESNAAISLTSLSSKAIAECILKASKNKSLLSSIRTNVTKLKPKYYWSEITKNTATLINNSDSLLPYKDNKDFADKIRFNMEIMKKPKYISSRLKSISSKGAGYIRKHGLKSTLIYGTKLVLSRKNLIIPDSSKKYIFLSHPIDNTGAPLVLLQIISEFVLKHGPRKINVFAPDIKDVNRKKLNKLGVSINKTAGSFSEKIINYQLNLKKDDFVLINTIAVSKNYIFYIFKMLESGKLNKAHWFIHEDGAQILAIAPYLLSKKNNKRISKLINSNLLNVYVPSRMTQKEYNRIFATNKIIKVPLRLNIDQKYKIDRKASEYNKIKFLISGSPADGRKGQLIALSAFQNYLARKALSDHADHREFELHLLSIGDDYISQQIKWIGRSVLNGRIKIYESMPYDEALELTKKCNAVICCSLNETFALYVAEGMYMGHLILRNNTSGVDEQLVDGKNGYFIDHKNIEKFTDKIEELLDEKKSDNNKLRDMGNYSQKIIESYTTNRYLNYFD
jgi:glycosyltransferase involved in cell wall biosynthesis